jgi:argininosuccinate lyase
MFENVKINQNIIEDEKYKYVFSVEKVNELVLSGIPFREAYKKVGEEIESGSFEAITTLNHTHEGSIGNLCNEEIKIKMNKIISEFNFSKTDEKIRELLS